MITTKCSLLLLFTAFVLAKNETSKPNIILFITDDQDIMLGSMEFMPKTLKFMRKRGVEFKNAFVSTPICCPSRSTILSGMYAHKHTVMTNNQNCGGQHWRSTHEKSTFGVYAQQAGYRTAYFGKYLNEYDGSYIPKGWDYTALLLRNSRYYNYTLNLNGKHERHGFDYSSDYLTDLLTNYTIGFIEDHFLNSENDQPFLIVLSYPACHGPEDPAPSYSTLFHGVDTHRTPSYNFAPNPDKQWILRQSSKMLPIHVTFTYLLHQRRLQTLQSVDESVHMIMSLLRSTNQLQNTFAIYTSDHGYHLGQFGLLKGKSFPYEFDIRVPFFIRGPSLPKGITRSEIVGNIDLAPTILAIAGVSTAANMSGRSLLDLFQQQTSSNWRHTMLIERGKQTNKLRKIDERFERQREKFGKFGRLAHHCAKPRYQSPCKLDQKWFCEQNTLGRWRVRKCRGGNRECKCREKRQIVDEMIETTNMEDEFLRQNHEEELIESGKWFQGMIGDDILSIGNVRRRRELNEEIRPNVTCPLKSRSMCDIPTNVTRRTWNRKKTRVDLKIQKLKDRLTAYKDIRKALKSAKPTSSSNETCNCKQHEKRHPLRETRWSSTTRNRTEQDCAQPQMNCFTHSSDHWRTPPFWPSNLSFCFCQNSNNNTYWCLRTLNETHNFLYCEFITGFLSYYDLNLDPAQLTNVVFDLDADRLSQLNAQLLLLKSCRSNRECEHYSSSDWWQPLTSNELESNVS
ncbi:hypothetical protein M3Y94_00860400 [Aphelenchoides besseyi]|nr:hypothetical protein M3Y94_00860400 [Aphelenchoides besseyi]